MFRKKQEEKKEQMNYLREIETILQRVNSDVTRLKQLVRQAKQDYNKVD